MNSYEPFQVYYKNVLDNLSEGSKKKHLNSWTFLAKRSIPVSNQTFLSRWVGLVSIPKNHVSSAGSNVSDNRPRKGKNEEDPNEAFSKKPAILLKPVGSTLGTLWILRKEYFSAARRLFYTHTSYSNSRGKIRKKSAINPKVLLIIINWWDCRSIINKFNINYKLKYILHQQLLFRNTDATIRYSGCTIFSINKKIKTVGQ